MRGAPPPARLSLVLAMSEGLRRPVWNAKREHNWPGGKYVGATCTECGVSGFLHHKHGPRLCWPHYQAGMEEAEWRRAKWEADMVAEYGPFTPKPSLSPAPPERMIDVAEMTKKAVDAVAESWASIDGKLDTYKRERDDPNADYKSGFTGHFDGYQAEAEEMIRRIRARGHDVVPLATSPAPSLPTREEIARVLVEHFVEHTGFQTVNEDDSKTTVSTYCGGHWIDLRVYPMADRILALFAQPQEKKP